MAKCPTCRREGHTSDSACGAAGWQVANVSAEGQSRQLPAHRACGAAALSAHGAAFRAARGDCQPADRRCGS
eukprot:884786-Lingulodinium_polyedra.AAC.1